MEAIKNIATILSLFLAAIAVLNLLQTKKLAQNLAAFARIIHHAPQLEKLIEMVPSLEELITLTTALKIEFILNEHGLPNKDSVKQKVSSLEKSNLLQDQILATMQKSMEKLMSSHYPIIDRGELLLIEDDNNGRKTMRFLLAKEGWTVASVSDVESALRKLSFVIPDVVILDLNLPDGNGIEVLKFIKNSSELCRVLILTGETDQKALQEVEKIGPEKIFNKPVDIKAFLSHINGSN